MIRDFKNIDSNLKQNIISDFKRLKKIDLLRKNYPSIDYNVLYSIVYSTGLYNEILNNQIYQLKLNDKMIVFISDTHDGSIYENQYYKYQVFDWATANGVKSIFHGGDFIQSYGKNYKNITKEKDSLSQAQNFVDYYPYDPNITTYGTYGNHDYYAIKNNEKVRKVLESRPDIQMLGFKKVYINWQDFIISVHHEIERFCLILPVSVDFLSFGGHSHFYHIRESHDGKCERIYMPAMCDMIPSKNLKDFYGENINTKPGFLTSEFFGDYNLTTCYSFRNGTIVKDAEYIKPKTKKLIIK